MDTEEMNKAIALLAMRVSDLEKESPGEIKEGGDGVNLRPVLIATLAHMKALRRAMLTGTSEIDEKLKQFDAVKAENEKLAYQISHLKRSLEAEEKKNRAVA